MRYNLASQNKDEKEGRPHYSPLEDPGNDISSGSVEDCPSRMKCYLRFFSESPWPKRVDFMQDEGRGERPLKNPMALCLPGLQEPVT